MDIKKYDDLLQYLNQNNDKIYDARHVREKIVDSLKKIPTGEENIVQLLHIHQAACSLSIRGKFLEPICSQGFEDGSVRSYPSIEAFKGNVLEEVEKLFRESTSNFVKLHYGHVLLNLGKKHNQYYESCIEGYLNIIKYLLSNSDKILEKDKNKNYQLVSFHLRNLLSIVRPPNEEVKNILLDIIKDNNHQALHNPFIYYAVHNTKLIKKEELIGFDSILMLNAELDTSRLNKIREYELGLNLDAKTLIKSQNWNLLIAKEYEQLSIERTDLANIEFAVQAMSYYKDAGMKEDSTRMAERYKELAKNARLNTITYKEDITEIVRSLQNDIQEIKQRPLEDILRFLIEDTSIIPSKAKLEYLARQKYINDPWLQLSGQQKIDRNGNIAQHFQGEEEIIHKLVHDKLKDQLFKVYQLFIDPLIFQLLEDSDWNSDFVINSLNTHTWYGEVIQKPFGFGEIIEFKILDWLKPSLKYYFDEIRHYKVEQTYQPDFTLPMDSLTLKIEGILREVAVKKGVQSFYIRKDDQDREVFKEKDINMLLNEPLIKEFLGEDLQLFLEHILVHRAGNNLRNDISHCFLMPGDYSSFTLMNLVLVAIFRLSATIERIN